MMLESGVVRWMDFLDWIGVTMNTEMKGEADLSLDADDELYIFVKTI